MKTILFTATIFLSLLSFWCGSEWRKNKTLTELNLNQKITIKAQKDLKDSLTNQIKFNQDFNNAYNKTSYGEAARWRNQITGKGK